VVKSSLRLLVLLGMVILFKQLHGWQTSFQDPELLCVLGKRFYRGL